MRLRLVCLYTIGNTAEAHANALQTYTQFEPLPWSDFVIARSRALVAVGCAQRNDELASELEHLRGIAHEMGYKSGLQAIEKALNSS